MVKVTIIGSANCDNCAEVKEFLEQLRLEQPVLAVEELTIDSPKGQELAIEHGILASPGILINNELFSMGQISEQKLESAIKAAAESRIN